MLNPAFIAVVILMVLLTGFAAVILHSLASAAGVRIRADMVKLLEAYDNILDEKSRDVRRLQHELETLEKTRRDLTAPPPPRTAQAAESAPIGKPSIPDAATYRDQSFGDGYSAIRGTFHMTEADREELALQVALETEPTGRGEAAAALCRSLSFDTVFSLSKLAGEEQLALLDETLNDEDWTLLRDFCEERGDTPFDITAFRVWLEERADLESGDVVMRSGAQICEGVQIRAGNKLYDYSINEREIG